MKLRQSLLGHYGMLLFSIFNEWQEFIEDSRGQISSAGRPAFEAAFVTFYTSILDPEITLHVSTMNQIPSKYIEESTVMNKMTSLMETIDENQDYLKSLMSFAKTVVDCGSPSEIDYVLSQLNKLLSACDYTQIFVQAIGYSSIGRDIVSYINYYRRIVSK